MKKLFNLFLVFVICLTLVPFGTKAASEEAVSETLAEAAAQEGITFNSSFSNDNSKPNVYLFRGHGCSHCYELIEYLTSIVDEYGKYFNLVSYEVWYNSANSDLMTKVASTLGDSANGVPYLVIGKKTFIGYRASTDASAIKKAIKELYKSDDKYDVMNHLNDTNSNDTANENSKGNGNAYNSNASAGDKALLYMMMILSFAIVAIYIVKSNSDMASLKSELFTISDQLEELSSKKGTKEVKPITKKVVKKVKKSE